MVLAKPNGIRQVEMIRFEVFYGVGIIEVV